MKRLPLIVVSVLVVLAAAGALWRSGGSISQSETATPAPAAAAFGGSFALIDQFGANRTDRDFRGKYMLIFFGYTYCPDICPTTLAVEAEALDKLGADAARIAPIFITVDPKRDSPEKLKAYLSSFDADQPTARLNFVGLTGTSEQIARAAEVYRVYFSAHIDARESSGDGYSIDHTGDVYLMDPEGKFVAYYSQGIMSDELAADLMARLSSG